MCIRDRTYYRRALYTVKLLRAAGIEDVDVPCGGMFIYFRIAGIDSAAFAEAFQEYGFEVSPGERFGEPNCIRWCLNQGNWVTRPAVAAVAQILQAQRLLLPAGPEVS